MTPGRLWYLFRREWARGPRGAWAANVLLPRVRHWRCPDFGEPGPVPVCSLTGRDDWLLCLWMLATWHLTTRRAWRVVLLDDGSLPKEAPEVIRAVFPHARVISPDAANAAVGPKLARHPLCSDYRAKHPLARKIFDGPLLAGAERAFLLDSDVLFYSRPEELLDWADAGGDESWFNRDVAEGSLVAQDEAAEVLGVKLWARVNSGLAALHCPAVDLDFCERCLGETRLLQGHIWRVEQTLFALCASRSGKGGLLPATYEVSLEKSMHPNAVARHYVGAVRDLFYTEGLPRVAPSLLEGGSK